MADILEITQDPDFKQLLKDDPNEARNFLLKATGKSITKIPKLDTVDLFSGNKKPQNPQGDKDWEDFKHIAGIGTGLATGGPLGALISAKFPPQSAGDYASMLAAPKVGGLASKLASKLPAGLARMLGQGVAGAGTTEGLSALTEATNRGANAVGLQDIPKQGFTTGDPRTKQGALPLAMGSVPPVLGEALLNHVVRNNPTVKQTNFANQELGTNMAPSELQQTQLLDPASTMEQVHQRFVQPIQQQIQQDTQKIQDLTSQKADIASQLKALDIQMANAAVEPTRAQIIAKQGLQDKLKKLIPQLTTVNNKIAKNSAQIQETTQLAKQAGQGNQEAINSIREKLAGEGEAELHTTQGDLKEASIKRDRPDQVDANRAVTEVQVKNDYDRAQAIKLKAEQEMQAGVLNNEAQTGQTQGANLQAQKTDLQGRVANAKVNSLPPVSDLPLTKAQIKVQQSQLKAQSTGIDATLQEMRQDAASSDPMHEAIRNLAITSPTPEALINNLKSSDPKVISAFREHVSKSNSEGLRQFQQSMTEDFFQKAYNPATPNNPLSNATKLFSSEGDYSPNKLNAIYGTENNKSAALRFQDAVNDITALGNKQPRSLTERYFIHSMYLIPGKLLYSGPSTSHGIEAAGAAAATTFMSIAYPKLVDMILKNPSMGRQFHEWSTAPEGSAKAILTNFPRLAAWWKANSEPVKEEVPQTTSATPQGSQ